MSYLKRFSDATNRPTVGKTDDTHQINVAVEFSIPRHALAVNVPALFKSLLQKMFAVDTTMPLLHWVPHDGNAITRATYIPTGLEILSPFFPV